MLLCVFVLLVSSLVYITHLGIRYIIGMCIIIIISVAGGGGPFAERPLNLGALGTAKLLTVL